MDQKKKSERYQRIFNQLEELIKKTKDPIARMSTIAAILHHKFKHFFWTGFYLLQEGNLIVGPYQGPVACLLLEKNKGVCWSAINHNRIELVPDVTKFTGHISCDSRSRSEIVIPIYDQKGRIWSVLDIDSKEISAFDEVDAKNLLKITDLIS